MSITDQQFEAILLRLESGESMASVQSDFPHLQDDIAALQDLQDFFAAQRLPNKPDPEGLRSVLKQVELLNQSTGDDEFSWGSFFTAWRSLAVVMPAMLVLGISGYVWQGLTPTSVLVSETDTTPVVSTTAEPPMDMAALAQSLSDEFASDMAEFETVRSELEPVYSEQLFSASNTPTL